MQTVTLSSMNSSLFIMNYNEYVAWNNYNGHCIEFSQFATMSKSMQLSSLVPLFCKDLLSYHLNILAGQLPNRSINQNIPEEHIRQNIAAFTGPVDVQTILTTSSQVCWCQKRLSLFRRRIVSIIVGGLSRVPKLSGARRHRDCLNCSDLQFQFHMNVPVLFHWVSLRQNIR